MPLMCTGAEVKACPPNPEHTHSLLLCVACLGESSSICEWLSFPLPYTVLKRLYTYQHLDQDEKVQKQ